jgi:hypothetical protein
VVLAHWEKLLYPEGPLFELSNCWADSTNGYAQVRRCGYELRFNGDRFRNLPEPVALFIIAHELAHVFIWANGERSDESEDVNEGSADAIAKGWGFDKGALNTFLYLVKMDGFENACKSRLWVA